jgi:hypothetical protein
VEVEVQVVMLLFVGRVCVEVVVETDGVLVWAGQVEMGRLGRGCAEMLVLVTWLQSEPKVHAADQVLEKDDQM